MFSASPSQILESKQIRDILPMIGYDTWLLLDLDNTVMESVVELGSDQWFTSLMEHASKVMLNQQEAVMTVIAIYQAVQHHVRTKPVEPNVMKLIKTLQDIGVPVIAVTARDQSLINTTLRQLHEIGIDFSRKGCDDEFIELSNQKDTPVYHHGIIFCNGQDKGKCLELFLEKCKNQPNHFAMVDDKAKHLGHVKQIVENHQKSFKGIRYGFLDQKVMNFDMKEANHQLLHIFKKLPIHIQEMVTKLNILPKDNFHSDAKYTDSFSKDPFKKVLKRKRNDEIDAPSTIQRSSSALSIFKPKKRKAEPMIAHEKIDALPLPTNRSNPQ